MEEKTQLPKEVMEQISKEVDILFDDTMDSGTSLPMFQKLTAYATKIHQAERDNSQLKYDKTVLEHRVDLKDTQLNNLRKSIDEAKKLLDEVFRKHESGLLPDRFIYEKIKSFLYGE